LDGRGAKPCRLSSKNHTRGLGGKGGGFYQALWGEPRSSRLFLEKTWGNPRETMKGKGVGTLKGKTAQEMLTNGPSSQGF